MADRSLYINKHAHSAKGWKIKTQDAGDSYEYFSVVLFIRCVFLLATGISIYNMELIQKLINELWEYLLSSYVFNSVYFETWHATFCYAIIIPIYPFMIHYIKWLDRFKIDQTVTYKHVTVLSILVDAIFYMTPLMLLDTFMVKKYPGVDPQIWDEKRKDIIQITRALPEDPPTVFQIVFQLVASILLYDALFFIIHFVLHKNICLYKYLHAFHHNHDVMHAHVTNQLTVIERIVLVLSANFALKVFNSHPLTRALFVPVFIWLLVENHTGYDLPVGLHRLVPFGLVGGAPKHFLHHIHGGGHYQPFLTYLDSFIDRNKKTSRKNSKEDKNKCFTN